MGESSRAVTPPPSANRHVPFQNGSCGGLRATVACSWRVPATGAQNPPHPRLQQPTGGPASISSRDDSPMVLHRDFRGHYPARSGDGVLPVDAATAASLDSAELQGANAWRSVSTIPGLSAHVPSQLAHCSELGRTMERVSQRPAYGRAGTSVRRRWASAPSEGIPGVSRQNSIMIWLGSR